MLNKTFDAFEIGRQDVVHFKLVAHFLPVLLPRFPLVILKDDVRHESLDSTCRRHFLLLIDIFGLGNSRDQLDKLVAHQNGWVHVLD